MLGHVSRTVGVVAYAVTGVKTFASIELKNIIEHNFKVDAGV